MCLIEYPPGGSILLMRLLEKLDEHISVGFTSNREPSEWVGYFPDDVVAFQKELPFHVPKVFPQGI
jgi:hypothetical protein